MVHLHGLRGLGLGSALGPVLPSQDLRGLISDGGIVSSCAVKESQIQPASLDLRLSSRLWRLSASFLPGARRRVMECLPALAVEEYDLSAPVILRPGSVYLAALEEGLALSPELIGVCNARSSSGRLDVLARVIGDYSRSFDLFAEGYSGPLYVELIPRSFPLQISRGLSLVQLRLHSQSRGPAPHVLPLTLSGHGAGSRPYGFKAKSCTPVVRYGEVHTHDAALYWEPLFRLPVRLDPGAFFILGAREEIVIPPDQAAELYPFDPAAGEFRVHYAGFFDPGFGLGGGGCAVLEVRAHGVPFLLEEGQYLASLVFQPLRARPDKLYGQGIGSSYQSPSLRLAAPFMPWDFGPRGD